MVDSKRDPAIGAEWLAWHALQGDEPLEFVGEYLDHAVPLLGQYIARARGSMQAEDAAFLSGLRLVLIGLASAAKADGNTKFKLDFKRVKRGKPINTHDRALTGHRASALVEAYLKNGIKQEAAIAAAIEATDLSRAEIFSWLKHRRNWQDADWREQFLKTYQAPKPVQHLLEPYVQRDESGQNDE
jgi:hypothetical protein